MDEDIFDDNLPEANEVPLIETLHNDHYDLEQYQYPGLRLMKDPTYLLPNVDLPWFNDKVEVSERVDGLNWSFIIPPEYELISSMTTSSRITPRMEKYKLRHEFVAEAFSGGATDTKLRTIFGVMNDDQDNLTPDFGFVDVQNVAHILELTTTSNLPEEQLFTKYNSKMFAYENALHYRTAHNKKDIHICAFSVIVVSPVCVASSVPLPQKLVCELICRMRIALAVENMAKQQGILIQDHTDESMKTRLMSLIEEEIDKTEWVDNGPQWIKINKQYVEKVTNYHVDHKKVVQEYITVLSDTETNLLESCSLSFDERCEELDARIGVFEGEFKKGPRQSYMKPVLNVPFVNPPVTINSSLPKYIALDPNTGYLGEVWSTALSSMINGKWEEDNLSSLLAEALETDMTKIIKMQANRKVDMRNYHRVNMKNLSSNTVYQLQRDGVWAKSVKDEPWRHQRLKQQRTAFSYDTNTTDLDDFFRNIGSYFEPHDRMEPLLKDRANENIKSPTFLDDVIDLLKLSNDTIGNTSDGLNFVKELLSTKLGDHCLWLSELAMELAISVKQHTNPKTMILKKLRHYSCYVLITPTTSSSHSFWSLYFPCVHHDKESELNLPIFRQLHKLSYGYATDFVSYRVDKLENLFSATSNLITSASLWCHFYNLKPLVSEVKKSEECMKMIGHTFLVSLEDKAETEETITITRYKYMELLKSIYTLKKPDPLKLLNKMNTTPRSRLNLYYIKKIIRTFKRMQLYPPIKMICNKDEWDLREEDETGDVTSPDDSWNGLINWFTDTPVTRFSKLVNLFYVGYYKNKNEVAQGNSDFKLVEKALEEEFKLDEADKDSYYGCTTEPKKGKGFSLDHAIFGCDLLCKRLEIMLGSNWRTIIKEECLKNLSSQLTHTIASLKASSTVDLDDIYKEFSAGEPDEPRKKVIESIFDNLEDFGLNPFKTLNKFITELESTSKGVVADLFKKQQHGGLREIYVLTIKSRVVQLYIEVLSRTICSYFEEETLTHPKKKLQIIDEHKSKTTKLSNKLNSLYIELNSSCDKTRWNQNFLMTLMVVPLLRILPKEFHASIVRVLNLWSSKKLRIPASVLKLLVNETELSSKTYNLLKENFWEPEQSRIFRDSNGKLINKKFIMLSSGMMQGILHYTSSLLHLVKLESSKELGLRTLKNRHPNCRFLFTKMCSSDDSAIMISGIAEPDALEFGKDILRMMRSIECVLESFTTYCGFFGMVESVKSTISVPNYVEFNSEFVCSNTLALPLIKLGAACTNLTESESFIKRFQNQYNLLSDLFNNGMPSVYAHICQLAQGFTHYFSLGACTNVLFPHYTEKLLKTPSVRHGFYVLDTQLMPGVMGFSFPLWNHLKVFGLIGVSRKSNLINYCEHIGEGAVVESLLIPMGDFKKWKRLVSKLSEPVVANLESLDLQAEILFKHPENLKELNLKLALTAMMPGVARSLAKGNPFLQSLAMSVYSINTHCCVKKSISEMISPAQSKIQDQIEKVCLFSDIDRVESEMNNTIALSQELEGLEFPNHERYKDVMKVIKSFSTASLVKRRPFRYRKNHLMIQPKMNPVPLTLMQVCRSCWFGHGLPVARHVINRCVTFYSIQYPWFDHESLEKTLNQSPFTAVTELYSFIASETSRTRKVVRVGPTLYSTKFLGQIVQLITKCQMDGYVFKRRKDTIQGCITSFQLEQLTTQLTLALMMPTHWTRKNNVMGLLISSDLITPDLPSISNLPDKLQKLAIIQRFCRREISPVQAINSLNSLNKGLFIAFPQRQEKDPVTNKWSGRGKAVVGLDDNCLEFYIDGDTIEQITVKDWQALQRKPGLITSLITECFNCRTDTVSVRGKMRGSCVAVYSKGRFLHPRSDGIPILVDRELVRMYLEPKSMKVEVSFGRISLMQDVRGNLVPIISYYSSGRDLNSRQMTNTSKSWEEAWLNQQKVDWRSISDLIRYLSTRESKLGSLPEDLLSLKRWLRSTLNHRLVHKRIGKKTTAIVESIMESDTGELEVTKMDDEAFEDLQMSLLDEIIEAPQNPSLFVNICTQEEEDMENNPEKFCQILTDRGINIERDFEMFASILKPTVDNAMEIPEQMVQRSLISFMYLHPFWDDFIDNIYSIDPNMIGNTLAGVKVPNTYQEVLSYVLSIEVKSETVNRLEQYMQNEPPDVEFNDEEVIQGSEWVDLDWEEM